MSRHRPGAARAADVDGGNLDLLTSAVVKQFSAAGRNGAGAITLTGAKVGDKVVMVLGWNTSSGVLATANGKALFEATITVANQIQQSSAMDLSGNTYVFVVQPKS